MFQICHVEKSEISPHDRFFSTCLTYMWTIWQIWGMHRSCWTNNGHGGWIGETGRPDLKRSKFVNLNFVPKNKHVNCWSFLGQSDPFTYFPTMYCVQRDWCSTLSWSEQSNDLYHSVKTHWITFRCYCKEKHSVSSLIHLFCIWSWLFTKLVIPVRKKSVSKSGRALCLQIKCKILWHPHSFRCPVKARPWSDVSQEAAHSPLLSISFIMMRRRRRSKRKVGVQ